MIRPLTRMLPKYAPTLALTLALVLLALPAAATQVERVISKSGIEAWLVRDHSKPITTLKFAFRGGAALDPKDKVGLANMVASTIDEGAGKLDSTAFQKALDDRTITLSFDAGRDSFSGTLRTLNKYRDDAFGYLKSALTEPRFDAEPVERMRASIVSAIEQDETEPGYQAARAMYTQAFPGHPYARPTDGTVAGIKAITADDLRAFVARRFARDTLLIGVVGDITPDQLSVFLDATFGDLPKKAAPWKVEDVQPKLDGGTTVTDVDVVQSSILFVQPGIKRNDPDFYTAFILDYILGGGSFVSRLYGEVREKRGLVYSVYSALMPMNASALVRGGAATGNARVGETVTTVRDVWRRFAENGPTEAEWQDAKTYLTGAYPLRFTSSSAIADLLVGMQEEDLGIDYIDKRNSYIEKSTLADGIRVAKKLYQPDKLTFFIAGKPEGLKSTN